MRPHEETWTFEMSSSAGCRVLFPTREGAINSGLILGGVPNAADKEAVCRLIAAAPEMARALLANGHVRSSDGLWHTDCCNEQNDGGVSCFESCTQARSSLTKAGVVP